MKNGHVTVIFRFICHLARETLPQPGSFYYASHLQK